MPALAALLGLALACAGGPVPAPVAGPAPPEDPSYLEGRQAIAGRSDPAPRPARNVILFVGDGMGVSTVTADRILEGQLRGEPGEENWLAFETLPVASLAKTYNSNQQVSDSAGTMTAMMSGVKTKAGVLGVSDAVRPGDHTSVAASRVPTLLEHAERRGLATGVVSTAKITHATPAACYAHSAQRGWEDDRSLPEEARAAGFPDLARQLVEFPVGDGLEVALGGGRAHFLPGDAADPEYPDRSGKRADGRDLMAEWAGRQGAAVVWNGRQLADLDLASVEHLLGLFEPSHMQWEADRMRDGAGEPSLSALTVAALEILKRDPDGFFLMVEAGRIDHGHHATNAYRALVDTIELSNAVRAALERVDLDETLVIVTADHSHTLTFSGYPTRGNPILGLVRGNDRRGEPADAPSLDATGRPYATLGYANGPGYAGASDQQPEGPKRFPHWTGAWQPASGGRPDLREVDTLDPDHLQETMMPAGAETHAGEDVPVYAAGPGAGLLGGALDQHWIYHAMVRALGWE